MKNAAAIKAVGEELSVKREAAASLKQRNDKMMDAAVAEGTVASTDFAEKYEAACREFDGVRDQVATLEAHYNRLMTAEAGPDAATPAPADQATQGIGARFTGSDLYNGLRERGSFTGNAGFGGETAAIEVMDKGEMFALLTKTTGGGAGISPDVRTGIVGLPQAPLTILDLITWTTTGKDTVRYMVETLFTNAAAETAEGAAYAKSEVELDVVDERVRKIGHILETTYEMLDDTERLAAWLDARIVVGVKQRMQTQLISGTGVGENLKGIINRAGILSQLKGTDSFTDAIHKALTKVRVASQGEIEPTVVGISPNDFETEILSKDSTGNYLYGGPLAPATRTVWGLIPVVHPAFVDGHPLVGDFSQIEGTIRDGVAVSLSDANADNFEKDIVSVKGRMRMAAGCERPYGFCRVEHA